MRTHIQTGGRGGPRRIEGRAACFAALALIAALAAPCPAAPRRDAAVAATDWGSVVGRVYDAVTGEPIAGARVVAQAGGRFADEGRTVSQTDKLGRYDCRAPLGRVSTKYNVVGALGGAFGLGGLFGPVSTTTRRIDVTQIALRITADDYHPFEGIVRCRASDPNGFYVTMEPVLLAPEDRAEVSTTADGWGGVRILSVSVEPDIVRLRGKIRVKARVKAPAAVAERARASWLERVFGGGRPTPLGLAMTSPLWRGVRELQVTGRENGVVTFEAEAGIPKSVVSPSAWITVAVARSPLEVASGGASKRVLVQVISGDDERQAAKLRLFAAERQEKDDHPGAVEALRRLCALPGASLDDLLWLAEESERIHDFEGAADALERAEKIIPEKGDPVVVSGRQVKPEDARWEVLSRRARALLSNGEAARVLEEVLPRVEAVPEKERPETVPGELMVAIGEAYLDTGNLAKAEEVGEDLFDWSDAREETGERAFRRRLRLAVGEQGVKENPDSAKAWAEWGRALMDEGRWEEGAAKLRAALKLDPAAAAVRRDLAYALGHVSGEKSRGDEDLDSAIAAAERLVGGRNGIPESRDFHDWHTLGILLYRKARAQEAGGDADWRDSMDACREALTRAVKYGRAGASIQEFLAYSPEASYGTREVRIAGFAYPQAASDRVVLESLDSLDENPDDYLAWFALATAFLDLGEPDLAAPALRECRRLRSDFPEADYAEALLAKQRGHADEAAALLRKVLRANPRHPFANLKLAELYAARGDLAKTAGCLAAHAAVYGRVK